jgi:osmotically-inducible protein OsmY
MLRLPRKWVMVAGLLATAPSIALAGPLDFLKSKSEISVSAQSERSNQQMAEEIAGALKKAQFRGFDIAIEFKDGVATLSGKISDSRQKTHATKVVSSVEGVQSVDNQLQVVARPGTPSPVQQTSGAQQPAQGPAIHHATGQPARSNQQVAQAIASQVVQAGLGRKDLEIKFSDGAAQISGSLDNEQQCIAVCQMAASVPEVRRVKATLTAGGKRFDPAVLNQIQQTGYNPHLQAPYHPQMAQAGAMAPPHPQMMQAGAMAPHPQGGPPPQPIHQAGFGPHGHGLHDHGLYSSPNLPQHAWPSYAAYDNYAAVTYPSQYDASAWPYIGPFYPYPQVPLGWREASLSWKDGFWALEFEDRTDRWWWFLNPSNWH